ncbi:MAG TPA: hypothetical protein VNO82_21510 [Solirubrobacteraceae bacterium]|nr:hypothetical protein [Solirubrobacteraceae bacterium]
MGFHPLGGLRRGAGRLQVVLAACVAVAAIAAAVIPQDAQAAVELDRTSKSTATDYDPTKSIRANCPAGTHVLGGGGIIRDSGEDIARLTALYPSGRDDHGGGLSPDGFTASAETVFHGQYVPWSLTAYAICSDRDNFEDFDIVVEEIRNDASERFVAGTARCPSGTVAYSAGAEIFQYIYTHKGRIGLQMVRTSGPMDIGRATARENTPLDTPNPWWLRTYAVCAKEVGDPRVEGAGDPDGDHVARSTCSPGRYLRGAGGGASGPGITDAGRSWLKAIIPSDTLRNVEVSMAGPDEPLGGVVTSHVCADHPGL